MAAEPRAVADDELDTTGTTLTAVVGAELDGAAGDTELEDAGADEVMAERNGYVLVDRDSAADEQPTSASRPTAAHVSTTAAVPTQRAELPRSTTPTPLSREPLTPIPPPMATGQTESDTTYRLFSARTRLQRKVPINMAQLLCTDWYALRSATTTREATMNGPEGEEQSPVDSGGDVQRAVAGFSPTALREARQRATWSTSDLAVASGVSASVISTWERGTHQPTITRLRLVAEALGVEITDLLRPSSTANRTLIDLRQASGLSLVEAATKADVHNTTLSRAETGMPVSDATIAALAGLYDVDEAEIRDAWTRGRDARRRQLRRR